MGEKVKNWIPTILAGLTLIIEVALNIFNINIQGALWLTVALLVTQIFIFHRELVEIKNKKPNIVVDGFKQERPFHLIRNGQPKEMLERYYVMFRNTKTPEKMITDSNPVHAIVTFYDSDCVILKDLSHEEPFWLDISGPPWERSENYGAIIKASSKPEGLCLVVRQQGGSDLYVFCDKSYNSNFRSLEPFQGSLRVPSLKFFVKVELKSENIDMEPIWISVTNRSERDQPLFEIIESPCGMG